MKYHSSLPACLLSFAIATFGPVVGEVAANPVNGLSRCLVYTMSGTTTDKGRIRNWQSGKVGYATTTSKEIGLLIIGPRGLEKAPFYDYETGKPKNVDLKVADVIQYDLNAKSKEAFRQTQTYSISLLHTGKPANPSEVLLAASWHDRRSPFASSGTSNFEAQGKATLASPYGNLSRIWHARELKSSLKMTESSDPSRPLGFAASATNDSANWINAFESTTDATYKFDKALSELVKNETSLEGARKKIEQYLKSKKGGSYRIVGN